LRAKRATFESGSEGGLLGCEVEVSLGEGASGAVGV
jgi:hypothetical protein